MWYAEKIKLIMVELYVEIFCKRLYTFYSSCKRAMFGRQGRDYIEQTFMKSVSCCFILRAFYYTMCYI